MQTLEAIVRSLHGKNRKQMLQRLEEESNAARKRARSVPHHRGERAAPRDEANELYDSLGHIAYFLQHGTYAFGTTQEEKRYCAQLAEDLQARDGHK